MGLKDTPIQVYETNWLSRDCILTEGEFKAMAAAQLGFTSIAIPGIGSFSDKHFPELIKLLNEHGIRCVSVIFDSEDTVNNGSGDKQLKPIWCRWKYHTCIFWPIATASLMPPESARSRYLAEAC